MKPRKAIRRKKAVRRSWIKPKKRKPSEYARIYGSKARVQWVKEFGCLVCGARPCDNAHTANGGMSRKADYTTIVPLCRVHHVQYDQRLAPLDAPAVRDAIVASGAFIDRQWQAHVAECAT